MEKAIKSADLEKGEKTPNSASQLERRFWNVFSHRIRPAFLMILLACVRKLE